MPHDQDSPDDEEFQARLDLSLSEQQNAPETASNNIAGEVVNLLSRKIDRDLLPTARKLEAFLQSQNEGPQQDGDLKILATDLRTFFKKTREINERQTGLGNLKTSSVMILCFIAALLIASSLMLGALTQERLSIIDRTGGWKNYIWTAHGDRIKDCKRQAREKNTALKCNVVEKP